MTFTLKINMDNDAFTVSEKDGYNGHEVGRILRQVAGKVENMILNEGDSIGMKDANGNSVGRAEVEV